MAGGRGSLLTPLRRRLGGCRRLPIASPRLPQASSNREERTLFRRGRPRCTLPARSVDCASKNSLPRPRTSCAGTLSGPEEHLHGLDSIREERVCSSASRRFLAVVIEAGNLERKEHLASALLSTSVILTRTKTPFPSTRCTARSRVVANRHYVNCVLAAAKVTMTAFLFVSGSGSAIAAGAPSPPETRASQD